MNAKTIISIFLTACLTFNLNLSAEENEESDKSKKEHFAFAGNVDYLAGPRLDALGTGHGCLPTTNSSLVVYSKIGVDDVTVMARVIKP